MKKPDNKSYRSTAERLRDTHAFSPVRVAWFGVALLFMSSLAHAETGTIDRIEWKQAPIRLELAVGQEQRIAFPAAVKVGVPAAVQAKLRAQSVDGTVYLLAHAPFGSNRLMVRELDSGRIYLLDVTAIEDGEAGPPDADLCNG